MKCVTCIISRERERERKFNVKEQSERKKYFSVRHVLYKIDCKSNKNNVYKEKAGKKSQDEEDQGEDEGEVEQVQVVARAEGRKFEKVSKNVTKYHWQE